MRVWPRHPGTLAVAFVLATLVWYSKALERRERISERQFDTAVTFVNVSADMAITSEVPRSLTLRVRGPLSRLRALDANQTGVVLDLRSAGEGEQEIAVRTRDVVVPSGFEVLAVSPSHIPLRLERIVRRRLPVRPPVSGMPSAGLVVGRVLTEPATVLVSGPRLLLEGMPALTTDPVAVDGAKGTVEALALVRTPHPLVRIVEPLAVRVAVIVLPAHQSGEAER